VLLLSLTNKILICIALSKLVLNLDLNADIGQNTNTAQPTEKKTERQAARQGVVHQSVVRWNKEIFFQHSNR
jgi:hypothetical protein